MQPAASLSHVPVVPPLVVTWLNILIFLNFRLTFIGPIVYNFTPKMGATQQSDNSNSTRGVIWLRMIAVVQTHGMSVNVCSHDLYTMKENSDMAKLVLNMTLQRGDPISQLCFFFWSVYFKHTVTHKNCNPAVLQKGMH